MRKCFQNNIKFILPKKRNINTNKLNKFIRNNKNTDSDDESSYYPDSTDSNNLLNNKRKIFRDMNHIYFRCDVTMDNINKLCNMIEEYNQEHDIIIKSTTCAIIIPKPIYLHITSVGGDLLAGFMAYDYIKNSKIPIYTIGEGYTISSGANMFMAGKKRFMTEHSYLLVHQLNQDMYGNETYRNSMDNANNNNEFMNRLYQIYLTNIRYNHNDETKKDILTKDKLENHMMHDIYWNYETCYKYGIVDGLYKNYDKCNENDMINILNNINQNGNIEGETKNIFYSTNDSKASKKIIDIVNNNNCDNTDDKKRKKRKRKKRNH